MAYLAIARKYRPATFDEIVGQKHVTQTLRNAIARGRVHHAYLFCGARGVGKTTAARALAKALNCVNAPTDTPCGVCSSCVDINSGNSPDLIEIDGASNNSVDDIRELRDNVRYAPTQGGKKIYLVDEVHMLSNAAFNALLKTLEEPPPHVVFLFATTEPHKIPDTILSRVQRFDFKRIPAGAVVQRLQEISQAEGVNITETGLRLIARAGEGSMRDSQSLLDKVISFGGEDITDEMVAQTLGLIDRTLLMNMIRGLLKGEPAKCLEVIATVYDYGYEMTQFSEELMEFIRHATLLRLSPSAKDQIELPAEDLAELEEMVKETSPDVLTRIFQVLLETHDHVNRAARPRIILEMAVARLSDIRPVQPMAELVARLEHLQKRLGEPGPRRPSARSAARGANGRGRAHRAPPRAHQNHPRGRRTHAARPAVADNASDKERWEAFAKRLSQLEPPASDLAAGLWRRDRRALVVTVPKGRKFAAASKQARHPEIASLLEECYRGPIDLRIEESLASRRQDVDQSLEHRVLTDPTSQRIMRILSATLKDVRPLSSDKES